MMDLGFLRDFSRAALVLDAAPDAIVVADHNGMIVFVNRQVETVFGYDREELVGKTIELLIPEQFRAAHQIHRANFAKDSRFRSMGSGLELLGLRKNGEAFPVEISLSPVVTEEGTFVSAAVRDITERKKLELQARLAMQRLVSAVESFQEAFALFDADDRLVLCNSAFRVSLPTELQGPALGCTFEELLDARLQHGMCALGDESPASFKVRRMRYRAAPSGGFSECTPDGRYLRSIDRRTAEGGTVTTVWDLTEDRELQEKLREAQTQAEAASAAKSEFLSSMSHELRTPLNAILGFAQLLQRDQKSPLNDRQRGWLQHVMKGGEHLLRLIDEVLDLAKIERGAVSLSIEPVGVSEVVDEVLATLSAMASRSGVVLERSAPEAPLLPVKADRTRFSQILLNFGSNAIKYGRAGTVVKFVVQSLGESIRVQVDDAGQGIPEDKQSKIFLPFHRAGQEAGPIEGTGIGLAISKRLAEMMGGSVGFRSVWGRGSSFWVELPLAHPLASPRAPSVTPTPEPKEFSETQLRTILYVEDNPSNLAFMQELLGTLGPVRLLSAHSAELGLELARAHRPDLILLDINLPGMSGFEAVRRLRAFPETRAIPVVALSASAMERDVRRALEEGFDRYLTKPVQVDALLATLDMYLSEVKEKETPQ